MPPLGIYQPALNFIKARPSNCLIFAEQTPKGERPGEHKHTEKCKKLVQAETRRKPVKEVEHKSSEEYYKHLFRDMLKEANQSKSLYLVYLFSSNRIKRDQKRGSLYQRIDNTSGT